MHENEDIWAPPTWVMVLILLIFIGFPLGDAIYEIHFKSNDMTNISDH